MYTPIQPTLGVTADSLDGAVWHKSSYSGTQGNCVEVARNLPCVVAVRDSKNPDGPRLIVSPAEWRAFVASAASGYVCPVNDAAEPLAGACVWVARIRTCVSL